MQTGIVFSPGQASSAQPKKRRKRKGRAEKTKKAKKVPRPRRKTEYISVPKHWFTDPLNHSMKTSVRPPTARTQRKELKIEMKMPEIVFLDMMRPFENGSLKGFTWLKADKKALKPTKIMPTFKEYKYELTSPGQLDTLWRLQDHEPVVKKRNRDGQIVSFRRGHGASRLHLSHAGAERGERTDLLSAIVGKTTVTLKVPKWGEGSLRFAGFVARTGCVRGCELVRLRRICGQCILGGV